MSWRQSSESPSNDTRKWRLFSISVELLLICILKIG